MKGAEWADKTMIDKACEWIIENMPHYVSKDYTYEVDMVDDFRKAMEGIVMIDFTNCPKDEPWMLFDNDGNCQMLNNEIEFCYARLQIAKNKLEGYFLVNVKEFINNPNGYKKYHIDNTGTVEEYPLNMFASVEQLSAKILSIRFKEE